MGAALRRTARLVGSVTAPNAVEQPAHAATGSCTTPSMTSVGWRIPRSSTTSARPLRIWGADPTKLFCAGHDDRWQRHGRPDPDRFITDCELVGTACIDLQDLTPQLRLEIHYALQWRH